MDELLLPNNAVEVRAHQIVDAQNNSLKFNIKLRDSLALSKLEINDCDMDH